MDLRKAREVIQSLDPEQYIKFMQEVHFDYKFKTTEMTKKIYQLWKDDHSMKEEDFDRIINKRRVEHLEKVQEKRMEDFKRIQDMKSKTGVDPLQLFPKEIWLLLLDELQPEDKRSMRYVHDLFRDLTDKTVVGDILLPMILGFKVVRFWGERSPYAMSMSPLAQYAELRLVSKSLRNAIDRWFENDIISALREGNKNACPAGVVEVMILDTIDAHQKFKRMKQDLSEAKAPRFFTRALRFFSDEMGQYDMYSLEDRDKHHDRFVEFQENINSILDSVGDQIWYFCFEFHHPSPYILDAPTLEERFISLLGWLSRMPNLKWLKLSIKKSKLETYTVFRIPEGSSPPTMAYLERLDLELKERNSYLLPIFNGFVTANSHVKILNLYGLKSILKLDSVKKSRELEVIIVDGTMLPTVSFWDADTDTEDDHDKTIDKVTSMMKSIVNTHWPLRRIDLELKMRSRVDIYPIFQSLEKLQTLQEVFLSIAEIYIGDNVAFLKLPHLEQFGLKLKMGDSYEFGTNWSFFFNLQFLMFAKKLTTLFWNCDMGESVWGKVRRDIEGVSQTVGTMIDFGGGLKDLSKAYLWFTFPSLAKLIVKRVVHGNIGGQKTFSRVYCRKNIDFSHWWY